MSKNQKVKSKTSQQIIEQFNDSDDDLESSNITREACINYTTDFDKWTVHHYYAMKKREKYPNMFFYYFPRSLFRVSKMNEIDKAKIIDYIFNNKDKNINGKWGYLSLVLDNININGAELFNSICNNRAIIDLSNSFPLKEDVEPDFDENIEKKVNSILESKKDLYNKTLEEFEIYLKEQTNDEIRKKYYNFVKNHEDLYIYCDKNKSMYELIEGIINMNNNNEKNNEEANNNIVLLPKNYYDLIYNDNDNNKERNKEDIFKKKNDKNKSSKNSKKKPKKKLVNQYKLYKCDFDLDLYENNNNNSIIEIEENDNKQNIPRIKQVVILDDEDMQSNNEILNNSEINNIPSKKGKHLKRRKKDIPLGNIIKYSEDTNKENYTKNDQNKNIFNINYSTNLSSNINLLESNSNVNNIFTPQKETQNNNNNIYDFNKENIEYYQNEQNLNGYISDFTKKVYYQNEINNKILVFSDNEDDIYLQKLAPRKKKKVTRIKVNEPVIIRQKNIQNYHDFKVIGMETSYIDKNIEKLKRGLLHKKQKIKNKINNNKRNKIIKQLKKEFKEEDFNDRKYQGNYKKVIREMNHLERNKKRKREEKKIIDNNNNNDLINNNIFSKKGNYYEIASTKKFNMNANSKLCNNKNINEYKKDRNFFNCFTNREKDDINFSDTESFLSLFKSNNNNNDNKRGRKKINNKKNKLNIFYDNSRNQNIKSFFPITGKTSDLKDKQIMMCIRKLVDNEKFSQLFDFIENDINLGAQIPYYISNITSEIFNNSNDINYDKINTCKNNNGQYEILYNSNRDVQNNTTNDIIEINENEYNINNNKIIINSKYDIEKLYPLFNAYLEKMQIALTFLLTESKFKDKNYFGLNYNEQEKNLIQNEINFQELNIVENLIKELISNMNITPNIDFKEYIKYNNYNNNTNDIIKYELNEYINKLKNIFTDTFNDIISQIFITYLRFFISYKPKEIKFMDVKDFCFMSYTFLQILQALFIKQRELENIYKQIYTNNNMNINIDILNIKNLYKITNKYIKCLSLFLLNHLFIYSTNDFLIIYTNPRKNNITGNKKSTPQESLILASLFKLISNLYIENEKSYNINNNSNNNINININNNNISNNNNNKDLDNDALVMFNIIFSEYLNNNVSINTNIEGSLSTILIKDLKSYLSSNINNCLSKDKKILSIISNLKKVFLYNCFDIDSHMDIDFSIKKIVNEKITINLIQRYLFLLISYFIYYNTQINCVAYFNDFYENFNKININNNGSSYFDIETISKNIIDQNIKLNGNHKVKGFLVEEYLYSDIKLMNFYDRYWSSIDSNNKIKFMQNYFQIMCFSKYQSRVIDNIFQKNEILLLINYIFEFKNTNNNNNKQDRKPNNGNNNDNNEDISIDNIDNNNKNNRDAILNSFDSIIIKSLYLISESLNKTLISLENNDSEKNIKSNLSKLLTIKNIFMDKNSNLNTKKYTLFIIPIISTILTFTQHLLKFTKNNNIETTIKQIQDILKNESSGLLLKSFSLAIWINIIQKISEKNINIDISQYVKMINAIIHQIVEEYHKPQGRELFMQRYIQNQNNDNKEKEYFEIIHEYLQNIKRFAENNPDLLMKNHSILNEIYDILNIKFYYPPKMRTLFLEIINSLIDHLNKKNNNNNMNNNYNRDIKFENNNNYNDDEDVVMLNNYEIDFLIGGEDLNEAEEDFLIFLLEKIIPNIKTILDNFISTQNTNVSNKKKILYPLYEENACMYAKIMGVLIKYKKIINHLEYPSYIFNQYYNKDFDRNNIFDSVFQSIYSSRNEIEKELYIKLPFKLFCLYLNYYHNLIYEIIVDRSFVSIIKYYMQLFFIGIFINKNNNNNNNLSYEEKYCNIILSVIRNNKDLLNKEKQRIKNDYNKNINISNDNKQRISIYNLLLTLSGIEEEKKNNYDYNNILIGELLSNLSIDFSVDFIDSELLFELINGPKTKNALSKIKRLSEYYSNKSNSNLLSENEINIKLYILSKYLEPYLYSQLNNKFISYIDDFIKELSGEQLVSSIVTMNFLNKLLSNKVYNNMRIPNKFKDCLRKVYHYFISKAKNICNILSIINREKQIKEYFNDSEINEIISSYKNKNQKNYNNNNFISFNLKRNIISNFITDFPLDNLLSSNLFINLLEYINVDNNNNNNFYYNNNKSFMEYYGESIYYYVALCNIMNKEKKISNIKSLIERLYDTILNYNNNNFIADIKSFYIFIFFLERINSFISTVMRIEVMESYTESAANILTEPEILLPKKFILKTINIIECFVSFMYSYIMFVIQGYYCQDKFIHSFVMNKINSVVRKNQPYFNDYIRSHNYTSSCNNMEEVNYFIDRYINEKYGKDIIIKAYKLIEKLTSNLKIYSKNDEEISKKIDFVKYVNFDGFQYINRNSNS